MSWSPRGKVHMASDIGQYRKPCGPYLGVTETSSEMSKWLDSPETTLVGRDSIVAMARLDSARPSVPPDTLDYLKATISRLGISLWPDACRCGGRVRSYKTAEELLDLIRNEQAKISEPAE